MKFREHRGSLADSMATCIELLDKAALVAHCQRLLKPYNKSFEPEQLRVAPYCRDDRTGWDTHIVTIDGYGVMGFTDGSGKIGSDKE